MKTNTDDYANQKINIAHIPDTASTYGYLKSSALNGYVNAISTTGSGNAVTSVSKTDGTITFTKGSTFLTSHQTLYTLSIYGGTTKVLDFKPNANASIYIKAGGDISLTNDTTNKYITLSYTHPTNGANTTISAANGKVLSAITVNSLGHVTSVSSKTLASADIPDLSSTYATASRATTLEGYFTNGVAKTAAKLNTGTTTYTAWGQTYWSSGVPSTISGDISNAGNITPSASASKNIGTRSNYFSGIYGQSVTLVDGTTNEDMVLAWGDVTISDVSTRVFRMYAYETKYNDLIIGATGSSASNISTYKPLFFDASEGRWGIGTVTPAYTLDVQGAISAYGSIYINRNNYVLYVTDTNGNLYNAFGLNNNNSLLIGYGTSAQGYNTSVYGNNVYLRYGTSRTIGLTLDTAGKVIIPSTGKLKIGDCTIEWDSTNNMLKFDKGIYSTGAVSALGANSSGGGGSGIDLDAMWASLMNTTTDTYASSKIATAHIPNLAASIITSGTFAAARIPNLSWTKITSDKPTTLSGYGITNAFTQTQSWNRFYALYEGTQISATSESHADLDTYTSYGSYYCSSNGTADYVDHLADESKTDAFRLWVSAAVGTGATYIRQRFQYYTGTLIYERTSTNGGSSWGNWYLVQANLANYALASSLSNYLPLSGGTMNNDVAICWKDNPSSGTASDLSLVSFSTTNNFHLGYGTATLGYNTYISGNNIYLRYGTSRTIGLTLASGGDVSVANGLSVGDAISLGTTSYSYQTTKGINIGSASHIGGTTASLGLYSTGGIYIRPNVTLGETSTNGIVLTSSSFTYNGNTVLHAGNSYVTSGKGYINGTEITTISGNAATATTATKLSTVSKTAWGQTYWTSGGVPTDISGNLSSVGNIYMANAKTIFIQDTDGTDRSVLNFSSNNNINLGYGTYNLGTGTYIYGKTLVVRIGGTAASANAVQVDESKNMTVTGYVAVGSGGANSRLVSDAADNIYLANSSGVVLVCKAKVVRRGSSMADVTLGSSTYPWGGLYSTTGDFSSTLSVTGASTLTGNITAGGDIYLSNAKYIRANNSSGTAEQLMGMNGSNQLLIGYGHRTSGSTILYGLSVTLSTNGTSRLYVLSNGNVGIANSSPSEKLHVTGNILASGEVTASSDERKKNIISNTKFNVKDIASARSIIYEWNDDRDKDNEKKVHGGSIAQDWLGKADSFLSQDNDGWYSINYGALALCSAITIARMTINHEDRITLLEKENAKLKARVAELEERRAL